MGILRIPFLCGLRLAKTILCLRASPGLRFSHLYPFPVLTGVVIWPGTQQDCQIKKTPFQVSLLFGSFLSSQVHHRPGCLSYGKSKGFPFYNDLQPAETILCFRAKYFGVCELNFRVGMVASNDKVLSLLATIQLNRNPNGFPINGSPAFSKVSS